VIYLNQFVSFETFFLIGEEVEVVLLRKNGADYAIK